MHKLTNWDRRYLGLADYISNWSKDPSTKVGCVISSHKNEPISYGINGFPMGMSDKAEWYNDREFKNRYVLHAEKNAIIFSKESLVGANVYITHPPCGQCLSMLKQKDVGMIFSIKPKDDFNSRWNTEEVLDIAKSYNMEIVLVEKDILG